jgi:hypothetical protein
VASNPVSFPQQPFSKDREVLLFRDLPCILTRNVGAFLGGWVEIVSFFRPLSDIIMAYLILRDNMACSHYQQLHT